MWVGQFRTLEEEEEEEEEEDETLAEEDTMVAVEGGGDSKGEHLIAAAEEEKAVEEEEEADSTISISQKFRPWTNPCIHLGRQKESRKSKLPPSPLGHRAARK